MHCPLFLSSLYSDIDFYLQVIKNNLNPVWEPFKVSLISLCSCDDERKLKVNINGIGLSRMGFLSPMLFRTCMTYFLLYSTKKDVLQNVQDALFLTIIAYCDQWLSSSNKSTIKVVLTTPALISRYYENIQEICFRNRWEFKLFFTENFGQSTSVVRQNLGHFAK